MAGTFLLVHLTWCGSSAGQHVHASRQAFFDCLLHSILLLDMTNSSSCCCLKIFSLSLEIDGTSWLGSSERWCIDSDNDLRTHFKMLKSSSLAGNNQIEQSRVDHQTQLHLILISSMAVPYIETETKSFWQVSNSGCKCSRRLNFSLYKKKSSCAAAASDGWQIFLAVVTHTSSIVATVHVTSLITTKTCGNYQFSISNLLLPCRLHIFAFALMTIKVKVASEVFASFLAAAYCVLPNNSSLKYWICCGCQMMTPDIMASSRLAWPPLVFAYIIHQN